MVSSLAERMDWDPDVLVFRDNEGRQIVPYGAVTDNYDKDEPRGKGGRWTSEVPYDKAGAATSSLDPHEHVQIHDSSTGEIYWHGPRHEAEGMLREQSSVEPDNTLRIVPYDHGAHAAQQSLEEVRRRQQEEGAAEAQRQESLKTPFGLLPGHRDYVEPPSTLYHATLDPDKIATQGFRSSDQLGYQTLGGSSSHLVSFTTKVNAERYAQALDVARKAAQGKLSDTDLVKVGQRYGVSEEKMHEILDRTEGAKDKSFSALQAVSMEGKQFPLFMGTSWPAHLKTAGPPALVSVPSSDVKSIYYNPSEHEWRLSDLSDLKPTLVKNEDPSRLGLLPAPPPPVFAWTNESVAPEQSPTAETPTQPPAAPVQPPPPVVVNVYPQETHQRDQEATENFEPDQPRDESGKWAGGGLSSSWSKEHGVLQHPYVKELETQAQKARIPNGITNGRSANEKFWKDLGHTDDTIASFYHIRDTWADGGKNQQQARERIHQALRGSESPLGALIRDQSQVEEHLYHQFVSAAVSRAERARKKASEKYEEETPDKVAVDKEYHPGFWDEERHYRGERAYSRVMDYAHLYRKGGTGGTVESWTYLPKGANFAPITKGEGGAIGHDVKAHISDLNRRGYHVLGGVNLPWGQQGEGEITLYNPEKIAHTTVANYDPSQPRGERGKWSREMEAVRVKAHQYIKENGPATQGELAYHLVDEGRATDHAHGLHLVGKLRDAGHLHDALNDVGQVALTIPPSDTPGRKVPVEEKLHAVHESLQPIAQALDQLGSHEVRERMMPGLQRISSRLTPASAARIKENMARAEIHETTIGCEMAIKREVSDDPKAVKQIENTWPGGAYIGDGYRSLHLSSGYQGLHSGQGVFKGVSGSSTAHGLEKGDSESDAHVTAHELGHVIDGPKFELSLSKEWRSAWVKEIGIGPDALPFGTKWLSKLTGPKGTPLTEYAKTCPQEGFAEFSRLLHASNVPHSTIEKTFPQCLAFWRSKGLWI